MVQETSIRFQRNEQIHITFRPSLSARRRAEHAHVACSVFSGNTEDFIPSGYQKLLFPRTSVYPRERLFCFLSLFAALRETNRVKVNSIVGGAGGG